jgi:hypothetical protein
VKVFRADVAVWGSVPVWRVAIYGLASFPKWAYRGAKGQGKRLLKLTWFDFGFDLRLTLGRRSPPVLNSL